MTALHESFNVLYYLKENNDARVFERHGIKQ